MNRTSLVVPALIALAAASPVARSQGTPAASVAFVDATMVPMDSERLLEAHTVVTSGDRVT